MSTAENTSQTPKTGEQLLNELTEARARIAELEIANARLFQEHERQVQEMKVINEVGQVITSVLDLDTVLRQIVDTIKDRFSHYFVSITLVEDERLVFRCGSTIGDTETRLEPRELGVGLKHGSSLVAEAVRTEQPVLADDVLNDPRYLALEELRDTRSELSVPIKAKGRVTGVLDVQNDRPFAYDQADVEILQSLANQAGVAIENARLFEETLVRAEELSVLNELGQALTTRLNVGEVVEEAYRGIAHLLDTTNFYVALYDPKTDSVSFPLSFEHGQRTQWKSRQAGHGLTEHIIRNRQPLLIREDVSERMEEVGIESIGEVALSWMGVPLMVSDQVLGVMAVQSYITPRLYDERALGLLSAIANQMAIALQNAQLVENLEQVVAERTADLRQSLKERENLQQKVIDAQSQALRELSTPIIPVMNRIIVMPLVGNIDSTRARDITRSLLAGIREQRAKVAILDITGVPVVDSEVADYLNKTIQAARLKGAHTIVTGISDAVAETIVDLGIDWGDVETLSDLQTGLIVALNSLGLKLTSLRS